MPRVLKPPLSDAPYEPYKLYEDLFKKKGQSRYTLYKVYNVGMLWCALSFALFGMDSVNPTNYFSFRLATSSESKIATQFFEEVFDVPLHLSSLATFFVFLVLGLLMLVWFSVRRHIYSNIHYLLHMCTLALLLLSVITEYFALYSLSNVLTGDGNKEERKNSLDSITARIYVIRIIYGIALSVHELCTFKLLAEICEPLNSNGGIMLAFILTSYSFNFAFDEIITMRDWVTYDQVITILLILGVLVIVSIISFTSLEVYQYIHQHHSISDPKSQNSKLSKYEKDNCDKGVWHTIKDSISRNTVYYSMILFLFVMACLYMFGVNAIPMRSGADYWSERANTGVNDITSLRLAIHFLILVTLPLFGALLDQGGRSRQTKKKNIELREIREMKQSQVHKDFVFSEVLHRDEKTFATRVSKSIRIKFRIILLCIGMILAVSSSYFYTVDSPDSVILYDFTLNLSTFFYAIGSSISIAAIYIIPKYFFSVINRHEIEEKAIYLKKRHVNDTPQYLYYLFSVFYEQTEFSGIRYVCWICVLSIIRESSYLYHLSIHFVYDSLVTTSIIIYVLSGIAMIFFSFFSYYDMKYTFESSQMFKNNKLDQPLLAESTNETQDSKALSDDDFDPATLFTKTPLPLKPWMKLVISVLTWPIDMLMSINMISFIAILCGAPVIAVYITESAEPKNRQATHPVDMLFQTSLFVLFIFSFLFVYASTFTKFVGLHLFKWTRKIFGYVFDNPYSTIKNNPNSTYSFSKYESALMDMKRKRDKQWTEKKKSNKVGKVLNQYYNIVEPSIVNKDPLLDINSPSYYVSYEMMEKNYDNTIQLLDTNNSDYNQLEEESSELQLEQSTTTLSDSSNNLDEHVIAIVKDDRVFPAEEKEDGDMERIKLLKFASRQEYLNHFRSEEFLQKFNERDYSFTRITNGTVFFKKSKYKKTYQDPRSLSYIRSVRPGANFTIYVMLYYCGYFLIPHIFSLFQLETIPTISNPYTFIIITCNFVFGFLMFFPLIAIWFDINGSITGSMKEMILIHEETRNMLKVRKTRDDQPVIYDKQKQVKINLSKDQYLLLDHDMITNWYKKLMFFQKTVDAKTDGLKNNLIVSF